MIVHYNDIKSTSVFVVNSRLPVYKAHYGDGLGNTIAGLFTRMAPKVAPLAKQLGMKALILFVIKAVVGDLAGKAFSAAKDKIMSLVRPKEQQSLPLPSKTVMPANVSKSINNAVEEQLSSLAVSPVTLLPSTNATNSAIMNTIAGSGLKPKRNSKNFQRR